MAITLNTTAPVPVTRDMACDSGFATSFVADGSSLDLTKTTAVLTVRPFASNGGSPLFADPSADITFRASNAAQAAGIYPSVLAFLTALEAMATDLCTVQRPARVAELANAQAAQTAAEADLAAKDAAVRAANLAVSNAHSSGVQADMDAAVAALATARAALAASQAAADRAQANVTTAQAALDDFSNPPLKVG